MTMDNLELLKVSLFLWFRRFGR